MELAVNYSPALARLVHEGAVAVDRVKVPDWDDLVSAARELGPVYVHFPYQAGSTGEKVDEARATQLLRDTGTRTLNLHVAPSQGRFPDIAIDDVGDPAKRAVVDGLVSDVAEAHAVAARVGAGVAIENLIYRGSDRSLLRAGVEPEVLRAVVEATGCGLVLDVSHARITAEALGIDPWSYLDAMPTEALQEVHVTGIHRIGDESKDHLPLTEDDWRFFRQVVARIAAGAWAAPEIVAFEYGGVGPVFDWRSEPGVLLDQVPRLLELVRSLAHASPQAG